MNTSSITDILYSGRILGPKGGRYRELSQWMEICVSIMNDKGLRKILNMSKYNTASEMFVNFNIPSFDELLQKIVFCFRSRIQDSGNSLVNGIVKQSFLPLFSQIWQNKVISGVHITLNWYNSSSRV